MAHEFFKMKRSWSRYKDFILRHYLDPYIPKVASLQKPILIVDCFAGCGTFGDEEPGSPLIISAILQRWRAKKVPISAEFIEADGENFQSLQRCLQPFQEFATPRHGTFEEHLPAIAARARQNSVFLYVDPYTVKGLVFDSMKAVYDQSHNASASVELLLNFNVVTFMRWGLGAVKRRGEFPEETGEVADFLADDPAELVELHTLDAIAGGSYWREIALDSTATFAEKIKQFTSRYLDRLVTTFPYAATYDVKEKYEHQVPKYVLIYGTRHFDGVELMNDGMCKARLEFLGSQFKKDSLFDLTPETEQRDREELWKDLLGFLQQDGPKTRKTLREKVIRTHFCKWQSKEINSALGDLLKSGRIMSSTGKTRINDDVILSVSSTQAGEKPTTQRDLFDCGGS
jgi:three-Cys-motif partner protein